MVRRTAKKSTDQVPRPISAQDFPRISVDQAGLMRLLSAPQLASWLGEIFQIDVRTSHQPVVDGAMLIVGFRCPGGTLSLEFSTELMPALSLAVRADALAEISFATLVAARLLRPFLERFGQAAKQAGDRRWHAMGVASILLAVRSSGKSNRDADTAAAPTPLAVWDVMLSNHIPAKIALLALEPNCVSALQDMVDSRPVLQHAGMKNWTVQTLLRFATRSLTPMLLNSLQVGDVLLVTKASRVDMLDGMLFCGSLTGRHWTCSVQVIGEEITMTSELDTHDGRFEEAATSAPPLASNIAELEVPVHFEIDSAALSLAQLASLREGYVISLSLPVDQAEIRLVACGQLVGRGKLVVIGDSLGVQIDHIVSGRA